MEITMQCTRERIEMRNLKTKIKAKYFISFKSNFTGSEQGTVG